MNIELIPPQALDAGLLAAWSQVQCANPALHSPFFRPEFTQVCAEAHGDVEIAVLHQGGRPVGFFPFHRVGKRAGLPIGKDMSDFQGLIAPAELDWSLEELMRACRLSSWTFNHVIEGGHLANEALAWEESPYIDLRGGFEAYRERKRQAGSKAPEGTERSCRLIARDLGEIEFLLHDAPCADLPQMLAWQRENLQRQGTLFLDRGCRREAMLERLLAQNSTEFAGWFSTLRAGGKLLAGTIYLRSHETCHWWITAYDAAFSRYSPGSAALLLAMKSAADAGITRIDLGRGMQELKRRLMSRSELVGQGVVELLPLVGSLRRAYARASSLLWNSPLKSAAKDALRRWRAFNQSQPRISEEAAK
jgi:CelD/BcsL family acetyltransferase involved in cellulose biosynthesis